MSTPKQLQLSTADAMQLRCALQREGRRSVELRYLNRLQCVALVASGHSCSKVAQWTGENPRSIQLWVQRYISDGVEGLKDRPRGSSARKLDGSDLSRLQRDVARSPRSFGFERACWNGPLLRTHLSRHYGVELSLRHCQRLLRMLPAEPEPEHEVAVD